VCINESMLVLQTNRDFRVGLVSLLCFQASFLVFFCLLSNDKNVRSECPWPPSVLGGGKFLTIYLKRCAVHTRNYKRHTARGQSLSLLSWGWLFCWHTPTGSSGASGGHLRDYDLLPPTVYLSYWP
jgi:hypothetical protein